MSQREYVLVPAAVLMGALAVAVLGSQSFAALVIVLGAVNVIAVLGLNIPVGFTHVLSIGQAGAFALGAYVSAILATTFGLPWWICAVTAVVIGFLSGLLMGLAALRVPDLIGLAMLTLGFAVLVGDLAIGWDGVTGGFSGIAAVRPYWWFGESGPLSEFQLAVVILVIAGLAYWFHSLFRRHRLGRSSLAVGQSEIGAVAIGIPASQLKMLSLGLANMLGAVAGSLYVYVYAFVAPNSINIWLSVTLLLMVILGGAGSRVGPVLGGFVLTALPLYLSVELQLEGYQQFLYGALIIAMVRFMPRGAVSKIGILDELPQVDGTGPEQPLERMVRNSTGQQFEEHTVPLLELRDVSVSFGGIRALQHIDFAVRIGEVIGLVGANGSGKTTLLNLASGYYEPTAGRVFVTGEELSNADAREAATRGVGRTFQTPRIFDRLTAGEHIILGRQHPPKGTSPDRIDFFAELGERVLFRGCGDDVWSQEAGSFSHGQLRFLEIAMAITRAPRVLLLDEPAAGLSASEIERLAEILRVIASLDVGLVVVEHHLEFVRALVDRVVVLDRGETLWSGSPHELRDQESVQRVFLGGSTEAPAVEGQP